MLRPRFTLRLALAFTAIVAIVAWQGGVVVKRRWAMASGPTFVIARDAPGKMDPNLPKVNAFRELLGDYAIRYIYVLPQGDWEREIAKLHILFPEAEVVPAYPPFDGLE